MWVFHSWIFQTWKIFCSINWDSMTAHLRSISIFAKKLLSISWLNKTIIVVFFLHSTTSFSVSFHSSGFDVERFQSNSMKIQSDFVKVPNLSQSLSNYRYFYIRRPATTLAIKVNDDYLLRFIFYESFNLSRHPRSSKTNLNANCTFWERRRWKDSAEN